MEMRYQYGLPDLRQLMAERTHYPAFSQAPDQFPGHQNLTTGQHYEMMMMMMSGPQVGEVLHRGVPVVDFRSDSTNSTTTTSAVCGFEMEGCVGGDGGNSRWPRQETLTLLEIRSLLDPKFKETNQKGPLWDEVSRIMKEEHGYQRSGKKCREKFENLYKYYKKTKEGKAGRQDGKHYRFFRQLEALYGESSNPVLVSETHVFGNNPPFHTTANTLNYPMNQEGLQAQKLPESRSISNSSDFGPSSSSEDDYNNFKAIASEENDSIEKKKKKMKANQCLKRGRKSWKAKIRDIINLQMRKFMERQEAWLEKILKTLDNKEHERISREEEWRKQEEERIEREHKIWANERTWFEARDAALMETLKKFTGREVKASSPDQELMATELHEKIQNQKENESETLESSSDRWLEAEISNLINLRTSLETSFQQDECSKGVLWEEISMKMACMGYDRGARRCEEKWENINKYSKTTKECNKRRKEDSRTGSYFQNLESIYNQGQAFCGNDINDQGHETNRLKSNDGPSNLNSNAVTAVGDSCFRFMMTEGENLWENYCVKLNKGENQ